MKHTLDYVNRYGLFGMVKNLENGTVLIHAKGKNLGEFKKYLKTEPSGSSVEKIDLSWKTFPIEFSNFKIEY